MAIDVAGRIRSGRVIEVLTKLVSERGAPAFLRSDNGPKSWCSNARDAQRDAGQELLRVTMVPEKLGSAGGTVPIR